MSNAHNIGMALFGVVLLFLQNPFINLLGLILVAWGTGNAIYHFSFEHHSTRQRKRIRKGYVG